MNALIHNFVTSVSLHGRQFLLPSMILLFMVAVLLRMLIFFTISREHWFAKEFEKRVRRFLDSKDSARFSSFFVMSKLLLERTYYELFEVRAFLKRRRPDVVLTMTDRVFLIQQGCARLVKDTLKQIRYLKRNQNPGLLSITGNVYENNPCFSRILGVLPTSMFNEFVGILPGVLIVFGIFGTFLGIMQALPDLGNMNLKDMEATKIAMDDFLGQVSYAMGSSITGILLSVMMTFINSFFSSENMYVNAVNRFENSLSMLWNHSTDNLLPEQIPDFDEHRDPVEALAENSIEKWAQKTERPEENPA
jgi:hypothetical protein